LFHGTRYKRGVTIQLGDKLTKAKIQTGVRKQIGELYKAGQEGEIMCRNYDLVAAALQEGFHLGEITVRLIDLGIKPAELSASIMLVMEKFPTDKLNERDQKIQALCQKLNKEAGIEFSQEQYDKGLRSFEELFPNSVKFIDKMKEIMEKTKS